MRLALPRPLLVRLLRLASVVVAGGVALVVLFLVAVAIGGLWTGELGGLEVLFVVTMPFLGVGLGGTVVVLLLQGLAHVVEDRVGSGADGDRPPPPGLAER